MNKKRVAQSWAPSSTDLTLLSVLACCTASGTGCGPGDKDPSEQTPAPSVTVAVTARKGCSTKISMAMASEQVAQLACTAPEGFVERSGDCDDTKNQVHPEAEERCNNRDEDCDGVLDPEELMQPVYEDLDGDGLVTLKQKLSGVRRHLGGGRLRL